MGCQLTCVPENYTEAVEIEHAVPLNLIHDHILGIKGKGVGFKSATDYILKESEDIQAYVAIFVVGVWVTKDQHSKLKARSMHEEFDMTANLDAWNVNELSLKNWSYQDRPVWLQKIMGRYEHLQLEYRPTTVNERWKKTK